MKKMLKSLLAIIFVISLVWMGTLAYSANMVAAAEARPDSMQKQPSSYQDIGASVVTSGVMPPFCGANIVEQSSATDPTWAQLQSFLLADKTDQKTYISDVYVCGDYARDVYNNAERWGIRAAYVAVKLSNAWHACNAFKTTDRGLVFIDCTGLKAGQLGPSNCDKTVTVKLGEHYKPVSLFRRLGWIGWPCRDMGIILDVQIYW